MQDGRATTKYTVKEQEEKEKDEKNIGKLIRKNANNSNSINSRLKAMHIIGQRKAF